MFVYSTVGMEEKNWECIWKGIDLICKAWTYMWMRTPLSIRLHMSLISPCSFGWDTHTVFYGGKCTMYII